MPVAEQEVTKLELRPLMGLAEVQRIGSLPYMQVVVKNKKSQVLSNVRVKLTALCIAPDSHDILYCECVATSSSVAHAIMAAINESDSTLQTWAYMPPSRQGGFNVHPQDSMRVADCKLALKGHAGLHHFALMAQQETFIIASDMTQLWQKLRKKMTCPTKEEWGDALMPQVMASGILIPCEAFGLPDKMTVYVLELDADQMFDELVGQLVKENGL